MKKTKKKTKKKKETHTRIHTVTHTHTHEQIYTRTNMYTFIHNTIVFAGGKIIFFIFWHIQNFLLNLKN